jgi:hypothetical protein
MTDATTLGPLDVALVVAGAIEASGGQYFVGGSIASSLQGEPSTANAFHLPTVTKIDFFRRAHDDYDESEFGRRRAVLVREPDGALFIKAPEDTVLRKLLWYRAGGEVSDRQWRDVVAVLRVSAPDLDAGYLDRWAARLGLGELLARARRAAR